MVRNFRAHFNYNGRNEHVDFSILSGQVNEETKRDSACQQIKNKYPLFNCGSKIIIKELNVW